MSYASERDASGRTPFYVLEVTLDQCDNDYTSSPCTAADAGDGARCFYSWKTCQDRDNYVKGSQTWRFISSHVRIQQIPHIANNWRPLYPILGELTQAEQEVSIFGGFARQEKRTFQLGDIAGTSGNDIVPELSLGKTGLTNTGRAGSFWRRMIAIHPNYVGRTVTLYQGFVEEGVTTADLKTAWKGKLSGLKIAKDGGVQLEAEDLFGDFEKKLPVKIGKANTIQTTVSRTATSVTVRNASEYTDPTTAPSSFTVGRVKTVSGNYELVKITARDTGANTLTLTRGQYGTTAEPLAGDDQFRAGSGTRVEEVLHYSTDDGLDGLTVDAVATDLLQRAGIDSSDIDTTSLAGLKTWAGPWKVKRTISKPTQVKQLLNELLELYQAAAFIDDDRAVKFWISRPSDPSETIATITDADILDMGATYDQGEDRRLTHASVAYGYSDDEDSTADGVAIYINDEAFQASFYGAGEENRYERSLKGGRWIQSWDEYQAICAAARWAKRSEQGRERLTFSVDLREESNLEVGTLVDLSTRFLQDEFGANRTLRCVVISRKRLSLGRYRITVEDTGLGVEDGGQDSQRYAIIGPAAMVDYDSDTAANEAAYGYLADSNGTLGAAGDRAKLIP